jgi:hypothetical protein
MRTGFLVRRPCSVASQLLGEPPAFLVARYFESIARIGVVAAWAPLAGAPVATRRRGAAPGERLGAFLVLGFPQASSRKPLHHGVRVTHLQLPERRHQLFLRVRAERRGFPFENDRPVMVPRRHMLLVVM